MSQNTGCLYKILPHIPWDGNVMILMQQWTMFESTGLKNSYLYNQLPKVRFCVTNE